ncbi:hypothetical protein Q9295_10365 [Xinfangfangia sp. CPCC 101601]|uniref:Uncharacterized protein n=1 Tax=Pseudogemmobacter lacusdianii TaxID=3069608 RepID=A0ABU0VYG1_9RHOB|nr:hypothetical protein [Xinfangfangia sp. CPCC 101601]MDQ2066781.1 hypothetical protein [Xinfangfangia sp. CPCC 101601]
MQGVRAEAPVATLTKAAVAPVQGAAQAPAAAARPVMDHGFVIEAAKARAVAAQRAYEMASLVAGLNPLSNPVL